MSSPLLRFVLGISPSSAKRMTEMSDFQRTLERTRATYIAVVRTHMRHLARTHTTYLAATRTGTHPRIVCEPNQNSNDLHTHRFLSFFGAFLSQNWTMVELVLVVKRLPRESLSSVYRLIYDLFLSLGRDFLPYTKGTTCTSR